MGRALGAQEEAAGLPRRDAPGILLSLEDGLRRTSSSVADALALRQIGQDLLVLGGRDVGQLLAATGAHQEEEVQNPGAKLPRQVDHRRDLVHVPIGDGHVEGEVEAFRAKGFRRPHRALPGAGEMAEGVVLPGVRGVEGEARPLDPVLAQEARLLLPEEHPVRADDDGEPALAARRRQGEEVFAEERLAAREDQEDVGVDLGDLAHDPEALLGGELVRSIGARERRQIAVRAGEVTALRQVPGNGIGFVHHAPSPRPRSMPLTSSPLPSGERQGKGGRGRGYFFCLM